jgi:hypothetical protein
MATRLGTFRSLAVGTLDPSPVSKDRPHAGRLEALHEALEDSRVVAEEAELPCP